MNDIKFTFGIITNADNGVNEYLPKCVQSILELNIPEFEIIIVGNRNNIINNEYLNSITQLQIINFEENIKNNWITKKKNIITQLAKFENIVYIHDYIKFDLNWYEGFKQYGDNFKACMTKIINYDGSRFRDWVLFPWHHCYGNSLVPSTAKFWKYCGIENNESLLPYVDDHTLNTWQYFSGAYWIAKKYIMEEMPLDENLVWEQGEDCVWSAKFSSKYNFNLNHFSTIHLLKYKQDAFGLMRSETYQKALEFANIK